ncbi:putative reverse transcriptase domain-containing protein [Tanacetum coccineum]
MGVAKLLFGLRTCQPMYIGKAVSIFDNGLRRVIEAIVVCRGPFFGDFQWRLASLPIRFGGLGLCSAEDVFTYAFVASRAQSWSLQDHILQGCGIDGADSDYGYALDRVRIEIVKSLGVSFDLSPRQKAVVECLRAPRAQNFLTVIPIEGLGQHMSALEYRTILKYRLMIPLFPVDEPCPVCRKFHSDGSLAMLTVDFSNAFNLVDRTTLLHEVRTRCPSISLWVDFLYGQSARLYVGDDHIWSTTGVQQGDPLGPLLFALVLHPLVHRIRDCCQLLFHAWYLDDGTIIGDTKEVAKAIDIIRAEGPRLGLELNIKKTEVFWPSCNGVKVKEGLFPRDIGRPTLGVKLLGGAVSRDAGFISSLAVKRASRAVELMSLLPSLRDPQSELLLLRSCMGVAKLLFGLRTCQPMYIGEAVSIFDNGLRRAIEAIVVCGGPFFGDFQWRLASLPIRFGGLGLCSAEDVSTYAFVASRAQSWSLQDHILQGCGIDGADSDYGYALDRVRMSLPEFDLSGFSNKDTPPKAQNVLACALFSEIVKSLGVSFDLSPRQKAVVECLRAPRAQNFLTVIPIEGLGQHMSALEYRTILKYRLMIPLFPVDEPCPVCRKVCLDSFGEHAVHCKELPGFKYRHDLVRDVLYDVLKRAGISSRKEAPVNFLTDPLEGRSTLRPADILVFGWAGGKHACVDLTGVSPLVGLRDNGFVAGQAALKAESSKVAKHEKACLEN